MTTGKQKDLSHENCQRIPTMFPVSKRSKLNTIPITMFKTNFDKSTKPIVSF